MVEPVQDRREGEEGAGEIHLIQHLFTREDQLTEHSRLLKVLLSHELIKRNCAAYTWRDNFSKETLQVLAQHAIQSRMSRVDTALTRLLVYCQMHLMLPLDCRVFIPILEKLRFLIRWLKNFMKLQRN